MSDTGARTTDGCDICNRPEGQIEPDAELRDISDLARKPAIRWLNPVELFKAGGRLILSGVMGEYADKRELEGTFPQDTFDYRASTPLGNRSEIRQFPGTGAEDPFIVDYVSDTGDGFAATYGVAWQMAQREICSLAPDGSHEKLPRGQILIHGGDLVYPTANVDEYEARFSGPYKAAFPHSQDHHPHFFAIPGNHDWYDGLTAFIRMFCAKDSWLGGRKAPQTRSYFALQLSEKFWLWGIDIQFGGYIDNPQLDYFKMAAGQMEEGSGIILATAEPKWHKETKARPNWLGKPDRTKHQTESMSNLDYLVRHCVGSKANVRMFLSGDLHNYSRYRNETDDVEYVTAGGGGAYLSPTHHLPDEIVLKSEDHPPDPNKDRTLKMATTYPSKEASRRLRVRGIGAGWRNPAFALLMGVVYFAWGWLSVKTLPTEAVGFVDRLKELASTGALDGFGEVFLSALRNPSTLLAFAAFTAICAAATRLASKIGAIALGLAHAVVQLSAMIVSLLITAFVLADIPNLHSVPEWLIYVATFLLAGTVLGALISGIYLTVSDLIGLWPSKAYESMSYEHKKNFLRMRIYEDKIDVWAVGIDHIPANKAWVAEAEPKNDDEKELPDLRLDKSKMSHPEGFRPKTVDRFTVTLKPDVASKSLYGNRALEF